MWSRSQRLQTYGLKAFTFYAIHKNMDQGVLFAPTALINTSNKYAACD